MLAKEHDVHLPSVSTPLEDISSEKRKDILRLWLRMLSTTTCIEQQLKRLLRQHFDITFAQFDLMAELWRAGEPKTMSEISQMLMVSNGNVTGVVDRLSRIGLVERLPLETDRRAYLLALTPEGKARFKEIAQLHELWLDQIFAEIDLNDIQALSHDLKDIRERLVLT